MEHFVNIVMEKQEEVKENVFSKWIIRFEFEKEFNTPPFITVGDTIKPGDPLCIIEAMKIFNDIDSEISGIVEEILIENGNPVEYGQKIISCLLYTSPSPRDATLSRMPSSA